MNAHTIARLGTALIAAATGLALFTMLPPVAAADLGISPRLSKNLQKQINKQAPGKVKRATVPPSARLPSTVTRPRTGLPSMTHRPVATATCPDLAVQRVWVDQVRHNGDGSYDFTFHGDIRNIGSADYRSGSNQQGITLYQGTRAYQVQAFTNLRRGAAIPFQAHVQHIVGGEFVSNFTLAIDFDPDIFIDGNPANDDCNAGNNRQVYSRTALANAFAHPDAVAVTRINVQAPGIPAR